MVHFKAFRRFNDPDHPVFEGLNARVDPRFARHFPGDGLPDQLARALSMRRAMKLKEILESFEFFERTRRRLRAPEMADLCCGHGLTGLLFALFEREVKQVTLIDRRKPKSFDTILSAVLDVGPWVADKITYIENDVRAAPGLLAAGTAVMAIHACGVRTDRCIDAALAVSGNMAVVPCCYAKTAWDAPKAIHDALGIALATDVHRTYRLEGAGYDVNWSAIPEVISPMHRILVATRKAER